MPIASSQKSSIDFLLSGPPTQERVSIEPNTTIKSNNSKRREIVRPKNPNFSLKVLQQPSHAKVAPRPPSRVFPPFSEHRPIHPPPVLQLKVDDFKFKNDSNFLNDDSLNHLYNENDPRSLERIEELKTIREMRQCKIPSWTHYSIYFVTARLQTSKGTNDKMLFNNKSEKSIDDLLIGTKVCSGMPISLRTSSPSNSYLKKSLPGEKPKASNFAITFVFSDLSVRKIGNFYLKFDLFEVYKGKIFWRGDTLSDEFTVYTPKKFPGPFPSTPLTSFLYKHGARIRQRKRSTPSTRKFEDNDDQNDNYNNHHQQNHLKDHNSSSSSSSSSALTKGRPAKLPKIQEIQGATYIPYNNHSTYSSQSSSSASLPVPDTGTTATAIHINNNNNNNNNNTNTTTTTNNNSNINNNNLNPVFTKLPSVEHFHDTVFNHSNQPPAPPKFRVINQQIPSNQQPMHNFPIMYTQQGPLQQPQPLAQPQLQQQHIPPPAQPPPPPGIGFIQHIPVATGFYHPVYNMIQQLPPQPQPIPTQVTQLSLQTTNAQPSPSPNLNQSQNKGQAGSNSPENGFYMGNR